MKLRIDNTVMVFFSTIINSCSEPIARLKPKLKNHAKDSSNGVNLEACRSTHVFTVYYMGLCQHTNVL